jgi:hypothetical protein
MTRNLKALGLALIAVFAMSAIVASAAQAVPAFTWDNTTQELTAEVDGAGASTGLQTFTTTSGPVKCQGLSGKATITLGSTEATEVTSQVNYTPCTGPFGEEAQIAFGQCDYLFTAVQTVNANDPTVLTGTAHIKCLNSGQITIQGLGGFCQVHVGQQTPGGHVIFHTVVPGGGAKQHVTIESTVTGIVYQGTGLCTSGNAGTYSGNVTIKGYSSTTHTAANQTNIGVH